VSSTGLKQQAWLWLGGWWMLVEYRFFPLDALAAVRDIGVKHRKQLRTTSRMEVL
jgi:hypothetical protein